MWGLGKKILFSPFLFQKSKCPKHSAFCYVQQTSWLWHRVTESSCKTVVTLTLLVGDRIRESISLRDRDQCKISLNFVLRKGFYLPCLHSSLAFITETSRPVSFAVSMENCGGFLSQAREGFNQNAAPASVPRSRPSNPQVRNNCGNCNPSLPRSFQNFLQRLCMVLWERAALPDPDDMQFPSRYSV